MIMPYRLRNASSQDRGVEKEDGLISQALADNMRKLRGDRAIGVLRQEMAEKGIQIGTGTLHRADKGELGIRVESLEKIGQFFDVLAAQLLQPGLGSDNWPLDGVISPSEWAKLPHDVREEALELIRVSISRHRKTMDGNAGGGSEGNYSGSPDQRANGRA